MTRRFLGGLTAIIAVLAGTAVANVPPAAAGVTAFAVPTSAAGLGRIATAPNGDMWFVEADVNKVGKITTAGVVTEYSLPAQTVSGSTVKDLDVGPDGRVWVVFDSGWQAVALDQSGNVTVGPLDLFGNPYGEHVRALPDGSAWVTLSYDEDGVIKISPTGSGTWSDNAPPCDDQSLGLGADGAAWCSDGGSIIKVNADGTGGTTYPLPADASYPSSLATGPVGTIWFGRHWPGTWTTSPSRGNVGYLDAATGATKIWNTGSRTAPRSLTMAPDGTMWFTSVGAAKGIGHIDATGSGRLTQVGNYQPTDLAVGADGAIWFTDKSNNAIVRVTTDALQITNLDPGEGSVLTNPPAPAPPPGTPPGQSPGVQAGTVQVPKRALRVHKRRVAIRVACPNGATRCAGTAQLRAKRPVAHSRPYAVAAGKSGRVTFRLTRKGLRAIPRRGSVALQVRLLLPGSTRAAATARIRVRR